MAVTVTEVDAGEDEIGALVALTTEDIGATGMSRVEVWVRELLKTAVTRTVENDCAGAEETGPVPFETMLVLFDSGTTEVRIVVVVIGAADVRVVVVVFEAAELLGVDDASVVTAELLDDEETPTEAVEEPLAEVLTTVLLTELVLSIKGALANADDVTVTEELTTEEETATDETAG